MEHHSENIRKKPTGAVQLSPHEVEDMESLGLTSPTEYIKHKLGRNTAQIIHLTPVSEKATSSSGTNRSHEDIEKIAKQEAQLEVLKNQLQHVQNSQHQGLGALENQMNERMEKFMRDQEFKELTKERDEFKKKAEMLEKERDELENKHTEMSGRLGTMEMVKEFAPLAQPLLAGLGRGLAAAKTGGFAGFLGAFGEQEEANPEKQESDEIAGYLMQLFTEQEREQIKKIIATFHQDKTLISKTIILMQRLATAQSNPVENVPTTHYAEDNEE